MLPKLNFKTINLKSKKSTNLIFLSDTHFEFSFSYKEVKEIVKNINSIKTDIIIFGGDVFDNYENIEVINNYLKILSKIEKKHKIVVLGNHEKSKYFSKNEIIELYKKNGFIVLENENYVIDNINFIGTSNHYFYLSEEENKKDVINQKKVYDLIYNEIHTKILQDKKNIIISHDPNIHLSIPHKNNIDLILSGHTHGVQIYPLGIIKLKGYKYIKGIHKINKSDTQLYISNGAGYSHKKIRLFAKNHIEFIAIK